MEWDTPEFVYKKKEKDWYASVIVIAGALIAVAFFFNDLLLIVLALLATITFLMYGAKKPKIIHVSLGGSGIRVEHLYYPYASLKSFGMLFHRDETKIILESEKTLAPYITIPVSEEVDPDEVHAFLIEHLKEEDHNEPASHTIMNLLGF